MGDANNMAVPPPPGPKKDAAPTEEKESNTWGLVKYFGAIFGWGVAKKVAKPATDLVEKYTIDAAATAIKTPVGMGVAGGTIVFGGMDGSVAVIGFSRANATLHDAARANMGMGPATRTPLFGTPLFPE